MRSTLATWAVCVLCIPLAVAHDEDGALGDGSPRPARDLAAREDQHSRRMLANAPLVQTGTDGADTLEGGEGWANIIYGYAGDDNLIGGDGSYNPRGFDDTHNYIFGGAGNDDIVGGDGGAFGIVQGGDVYNFLHGGAGDDTLSGGDSFPLEAYGTNAYNYVYGGQGEDTLYGGYSAYDVLEGGAGYDKIFADNANDGWLGGRDVINVTDGEYDKVYARDGAYDLVYADVGDYVDADETDVVVWSGGDSDGTGAGDDQVRCDLGPHARGQSCSRCTRLLLSCVPSGPSRRGRNSHNDPTSRMSSAVLALRAMPGHGPEATAPLLRALDMPTEFSSVSWAIHHAAMHEASHSVNSIWIGQFLTLARRKESWVLTHDALRLARSVDLPYAETMRQLRAADEAVALQPSRADVGEPRQPDYVAEWHALDCPCVTRSEHVGVIQWYPNAALARFWAAHAPTEGLEAILGERVDSHVPDFSDDWLSLLSTDAERRAFMGTWVRMYAQVALPEAGLAAGGTRCVQQHIEACCPQLVHLRLGGRTIGPLRVRIRLAVQHATQALWDCVALEPVVAAEPVGGAAGVGAPGAAQRQPMPPVPSLPSQRVRADGPRAAGCAPLALHRPVTSEAEPSDSVSSMAPPPAFGNDDVLLMLADALPLDELAQLAAGL